MRVLVKEEIKKYIYTYIYISHEQQQQPAADTAAGVGEKSLAENRVES